MCVIVGETFIRKNEEEEGKIYVNNFFFQFSLMRFCCCFNFELINVPQVAGRVHYTFQVVTKKKLTSINTIWAMRERKKIRWINLMLVESSIAESDKYTTHTSPHTKHHHHHHLNAQLSKERRFSFQIRYESLTRFQRWDDGNDVEL